MRRAWAVLFAGVASAVALAAPQDPPEPVALQAHVGGGMSSRAAAISVAKDGAATVECPAIGTPPRRERIEVAIRLTAAEMDDLRRRVLESRFLGEWGASRNGTDQVSWDVTVSVGTREKRRAIYDQPEFEPLELWLWRFVQQAEAVDSIRQGGAAWVAESIQREDERARLIRPDDLAAELVPALQREAVAAERPSIAGQAARWLAHYAAPADGAARLAEILAHTEGERRDAVVVEWMRAVTSSGREAHRAAFDPIALAEVRRPWEERSQGQYRHDDALRAVLGYVLRRRVPGATEAAAEKVHSVSTLDAPFIPSGIADLGADGVAFGLRLLEDPDPAPRRAAALILRALASAAQRRPASGLPFDALAHATTWARLSGDAVPALERHAKSPQESLRVREECFDALAVCAGRDPEADRHAAYREKDARRKAEWKEREERSKAEDARRAEAAEAEAAKYRQEAPPKGGFSISGRVLGPGATPLAGFGVAASRQDGPPAHPRRVFGWARTADDGSFRIDGLVAGAFTLVATGPDWTWRTMPKNSTLTDDVDAGETGVELRFAGAMLRGRVVGADGKPLARRDVSARMRDAPGVQSGLLHANASAQTDVEGRFLFLQLYEGVYDIEVPGAPKLAGAAAIDVTSPEERTIRVVEGDAIRGRVVDETGAPLPGAVVSAREEGTIRLRGPVAAATTAADGKFRIIGLDASLHYVVSAGYAAPTFNLGSDRLAESVAPGGGPVELRIDTGPQLAVRVEFSGRAPESPGPRVRLVLDGAASNVQEFHESAVLWRAAPEGVWRVFARVRDLDETGARVDRWIELGTVRTGEPERTLTVPR